MNQQLNLRSGSILITVVIFGFAIFAAVAGYLLVATNAMKLANRTIHMSSCMNLAEAGVEEALFTLNKYQPTAFATPDLNAWTNWTLSGSDARRSFPKGYFKSAQQGTEGEFSILVSNYATATPVIVVRARSWIKNEAVIEKYLWGTGGRRSYVEGGWIAEEEVTLNGNLVADSYDSRLGAFGGSNVDDNAFIASASITKVTVGNADVFGVVATGGSTPPQVMGKGWVGPSPALKNKDYDPDSVSYGFEANFPPPPDFPTSGNSFNAPSYYTLASAATAETNGTLAPGMSDYFHYDSGTDTYYLGETGATSPVAFTFTSISSAKIVLRGPVRIKVDADFTMTTGGVSIQQMDQVFNVSGGIPISLKDPTKPPLAIWLGGNMKLAGNGLLNYYESIPAAAQIYGIGGTEQEIDVHGNGSLSATIYAPNATVTMVGGGANPDVFGGAVCRVLKAGSATVHLHCDEALRDLKLGQFGIDLLRELKTPTERVAYTF